MEFQSTLPSRGVTILREIVDFVRTKISIHTPLAGSDDYDDNGKYTGEKISIHTPLAGSDF